MMDYFPDQQPRTAQENRALDQISIYADEAERSAHFIREFIDRFRGHGAGEKANVPTAVPSGHSGQIERLGQAISTIDKLARELQTIG